MDFTLTTTDPLLISVDYSRSLIQMIAAGRYDWTSGCITPKRFPISDEGIIEFQTILLKFDENVSSEAAVETIRKLGEGKSWEPAGIEHLLAFGEKYPEAQRDFPIAALGSVCELRGGRGAPRLVGRGAERYLYLYSWDGGWNSLCRFLAVRNISQPSAS